MHGVVGVIAIVPADARVVLAVAAEGVVAAIAVGVALAIRVRIAVLVMVGRVADLGVARKAGRVLVVAVAAATTHSVDAIAILVAVAVRCVRLHGAVERVGIDGARVEDHVRPLAAGGCQEAERDEGHHPDRFERTHHCCPTYLRAFLAVQEKSEARGGRQKEHGSP